MNISIYFYTYYSDGYGRCKWTTNTEEPSLFLKYSDSKLNIFDIEKKTLLLKDPIPLRSGINSGRINFSFIAILHLTCYQPAEYKIPITLKEIQL